MFNINRSKDQCWRKIIVWYIQESMVSLKHHHLIYYSWMDVAEAHHAYSAKRYRKALGESHQKSREINGWKNKGGGNGLNK